MEGFPTSPEQKPEQKTPHELARLYIQRADELMKTGSDFDKKNAAKWYVAAREKLGLEKGAKLQDIRDALEKEN